MNSPSGRAFEAEYLRHLGSMVVAMLFGVVACSSKPEATFSRAELLDSQTCASCHPKHFEEWQSSMHAYAADDPVFLAMNQRGQRETQGELGDFCVKCHAPMALLEGATFDGLNLDTVPQQLKGVTCYFCHNAVAVEGTHNNPVVLGHDATLRGGIRNPTSNPVHGSGYSPLLDRHDLASSNLCGACHDVVNQHGVALERTFREWKDSIFSSSAPGQGLSCSACHMTGRDDVAAAGGPARRAHEHTFAGIDVALSPWPGVGLQKQAIARDLDPAIITRLCVAKVDGGVRVDVSLENALAGHSWPSGAAQDREAWVELVAYAEGEMVYQSGLVTPGESPKKTATVDLWLLGDTMFDENDQPVHMFWEARRVESNLLPPVTTLDPKNPKFFHAVTRQYRIPREGIDRVTARVHIRPLKHELLESLISSGDLDPVVASRVPTHSPKGASVEWTAPIGFQCVQQ